MNYNYKFRDINEALPSMMSQVLGGRDFPSRAGMTKELMHVGITLSDPNQREILLPSRKANLAAQIAETMWVLAGRDDMAFLSRYLPRAEQFSDDGERWRAGYGARLRNFQRKDQLQYVVDLLKEDPNTRQAVMSIWDPTIDTAPGKDIPCNNWLSFSIRQGWLDLHVAVRSNDAMWGWSGINVFEWSSLLEVVAGLVGMTAGRLHFSVTSFHLYDHHWDKAKVLAGETARPVYQPSPRFTPLQNRLAYFDGLAKAWFQIENMLKDGPEGGMWPQAATSINAFTEPMLQSWLRVLQWWWSGDTAYLGPLEGTNLYAAASVAVQPKPKNAFLEYVNALHADKHQAYGDSWKRRGEMLGIMANIARKVDRLGTNSSDETSADTAIDLLVYLGKYHCWLRGAEGTPTQVEAFFDDYVLTADLSVLEGMAARDLEQRLTHDFAILEDQVMKAKSQRIHLVSSMSILAYALARMLWTPST